MRDTLKQALTTKLTAAPKYSSGYFTLLSKVRDNARSRRRERRRQQQMATKLTVSRLALIKSIEEKATENQKAHDAAVAAQPKDDLISLLDKKINEMFKNIAANSTNALGYTKANVVTAKSTLLAYMGLNSQVIPEPKLFKKELAVLKMAQDENLVIDDSSDYFSFLK